MKLSSKIAYILIGAFLTLGLTVYAVNVTIPSSPGFGYVPLGNANGTYTPVATSTLGISGGGGSSSTTINSLSGPNFILNNVDGTVTFATSAPGTITLRTQNLQPAGSYVTNSYASATFATILSLNAYLTTTTAASTYYLQTNPSNYISGNQSITLSGDVSGSGATSITTTLATVNSNVGSFGGASQMLQATVNAKGLVTAISTTTPSIPVGDITGVLPVGSGGTGTTTPGLIQGANITITGTWPFQTVAVTNSPSFSGTLGVTGTSTLATTTATNMTVGGQMTSTEVDATITTATFNISLNQGNTLTYVLATTSAITFVNGTAGQKINIYFIQDATGNRVPTLSSCDYGGGSAPTWSTAAGKFDEVSVNYINRSGYSAKYICQAGNQGF